MKTVIEPWNAPTLPVAGSGERFPVRHIYCVGRKNAAPAKQPDAE